jgi:nitrogen fixation NifU-like protein
MDAAAVEVVSDELDAMLKGAAPNLAAWPELGMFVPARAHASRHRCVLLPFRALIDALKAAGSELGAGDTANTTGQHGET